MIDTDPPPLESNRAYRYLLVLELLLTIVFFGLSTAALLGLL